MAGSLPNCNGFGRLGSGLRRNWLVERVSPLLCRLVYPLRGLLSLRCVRSGGLRFRGWRRLGPWLKRRTNVRLRLWARGDARVGWGHRRWSKRFGAPFDIRRPLRGAFAGCAQLSRQLRFGRLERGGSGRDVGCRSERRRIRSNQLRNGRPLATGVTGADLRSGRGGGGGRSSRSLGRRCLSQFLFGWLGSGSRRWGWCRSTWNALDLPATRTFALLARRGVGSAHQLAAAGAGKLDSHAELAKDKRERCERRGSILIRSRDGGSV